MGPNDPSYQGAQAAYDCSQGSALPDREAAFGGYLAALQREHHAARIYRERTEHLRGIVGDGTVAAQRACQHAVSRAPAAE